MPEDESPEKTFTLRIFPPDPNPEHVSPSPLVVRRANQLGLAYTFEEAGADFFLRVDYLDHENRQGVAITRYLTQDIDDLWESSQRKIQGKAPSVLSKTTIEKLEKFKLKILKKRTKEEEDESKTLRKSFFVAGDGVMYEQINNGGVQKFIGYPKGNLTTIDSIPYGEYVIVPINNRAIHEGAVLLPSGVMEYKSINTLIQGIENHIRKYLDVSDYFIKLSAWYILLTWLYDKLNVVPYLRALGDTGTGKSRFLDVIGRLCYKATIVSGAVTPAPIYRMLRIWGGTMVLDEADFRHSDEKNEVITILNCGFERGRPVIRCDRNNPDDIQILPTFCPKVFATRKRFKDVALESRCITEKLYETTRKDIPEQLPKSFYEEEGVLRNKLLKFRFDYRDKVDLEKIQGLDLGDIEPRLKQTTSSFAVLFSNIDGVMEDFREFLRKFNAELVEERSNTDEGLIVNAIFGIVSSNGAVPLCNETHETHETEISSQDIGKQIKETYSEDIHYRKIGSILKNTFGLDTKTRRIGKKTRRWLIWDSGKMAVLKRRYVSSVSSVALHGGREGLDETEPEEDPKPADAKHIDAYTGEEIKEEYPEGIEHPIVKGDKAKKK